MSESEGSFDTLNHKLEGLFDTVGHKFEVSLKYNEFLWFGILFDMVELRLNFSQTLTLNDLNQGQGQR